MDIYEQITNQIIDELKKGNVPWRKPWKGGSYPCNFKTGRKYSGINALLLSMFNRNYDSPYWLTYKQAKQLGGWIRRGEKAQLIMFWDNYEKEDDDGKKKKIFFARSYFVFNVEQCENLKKKTPPGVSEEPAEELDFQPIKQCEKIVKSYKGKPKINHKGNQACYVPSEDAVFMPVKKKFRSESEYYSVIFHELVHSTGAAKRLDRSGITAANGFGTKKYSEEELVAEFGAAFLCGHGGIANDTVDNSTAYIRGWMKKLRSDTKLAIYAAGKAQKAADFILGERKSK